MKLHRERLNRKDIQVKELYKIVLENPFYISDGNSSFNKFFIKYPKKIFQIKERENEVLKFYENCPYLICVNKNHYKSVLKHKGQFYYSTTIINFFNSDKSRMIDIFSVSNVDFEYYNPIAVKNLLETVKDNHLSLGDKKIIKDIAIKSFHEMLEISSNHEVNGITFVMCLRTDLHDITSNELKKYGFNVNHPYRFKDINLV